ncbi:MAG: 30S ribosomal protein S6 [Clostridia bacterium]
MRKYETIFILDCEIEEEAQKAIIERVKAEIEGAKGVIGKLDEWGKKKLAYPINFKTDGYYVFIEFEAEAELPLALERIYRITEGILKGLIVRKDD